MVLKHVFTLILGAFYNNATFYNKRVLADVIRIFEQRIFSGYSAESRPHVGFLNVNGLPFWVGLEDWSRPCEEHEVLDSLLLT